jgi:tetratricopeptide (TPR) repeat protein
MFLKAILNFFALPLKGNYHSSRHEFDKAISYYEQYFELTRNIGDIEGEAKACHFLGYAHYCLQNYTKAIEYYDRDLNLSKEMQDRVNMGRAYCNLGINLSDIIFNLRKVLFIYLFVI